MSTPRTWHTCPIFLLLIPGLLVGVPGLIHAQEVTTEAVQDWSAEQEEVWEREKMYWELRKAADVERFMDLWDDEFAGWPSSETGVIDRRELKELVVEEFTNRSPEFGYKLVPFAVRVYGDDIGIAFYGVGDPDEEGSAYDGRIMHVWRKQDGEWKIIGGMSAPSNPTEGEQ